MIFFQLIIYTVYFYIPPKSKIFHHFSCIISFISGSFHFHSPLHQNYTFFGELIRKKSRKGKIPSSAYSFFFNYFFLFIFAQTKIQREQNMYSPEIWNLWKLVYQITICTFIHYHTSHSFRAISNPPICVWIQRNINFKIKPLSFTIEKVIQYLVSHWAERDTNHRCK